MFDHGMVVRADTVKSFRCFDLAIVLQEDFGLRNIPG